VYLCFLKKVGGRCGCVYRTEGAVDRKSLGTTDLQARGAQEMSMIKSDITGNRKERKSKFHLSAAYSQSQSVVSIVFARVCTSFFLS
jgi:hypothetical protein